MSQPGSEPFQSAEWRGKLRRYAEELIECLTRNLKSIAGTGIDLNAESRMPLTIDPHRLSNLPQSTEHAMPERGTADRTALSEQSMLDAPLFQKWLDQSQASCKPLVLIAPFGCGKSVTLGYFTLMLAEQLKAWCEASEPNVPMPWVPFPVRLRKWMGDISLWDYMTSDAQRDINEYADDAALTKADLQTLGRFEKLLPLFDGLDELPESAASPSSGQIISSRAKAIDSILDNKFVSRRHVISSRPGHGIETSEYYGRAVFHELHELDTNAAEAFICRRFAVPADKPDHPILLHFRAARPAVDDLVRRPLFLAAWCRHAEKSVGRQNDWAPLPTTISGLMGAVLEEVLKKDDERLARRLQPREANAATRAREVLHDPYRLGAVLAIHADAGFSRQVDASTRRRTAKEHHVYAFAGASYEWYETIAIEIGLLLRGPLGTYVQKIPVVEYLIGHYYAWLIANRDDEPRNATRQLVAAFQRRFWWRDHDEVWLYAFDELWHGNPAQVAIAGDLVRWVLNLSQACLDAANREGPLGAGQEESDREPFTCYRFVLRALLPSGHASGAIRRSAEDLVDRAFEQLNAEAIDRWTRNSPVTRLEAVVRRHSKRLCEWSLACLRDPKFRDQRAAIAKTIDRNDFGSYLPIESLPQLLEHLADKCYARAWPSIANALGAAAAQLGSPAVTQLLKHLADERYAPAWGSIATALDTASSHLGRSAVTQLLEHLADERYAQAQHLIAIALGAAATQLGLAVVTQLLEHLADERYAPAWNWIASALDAAEMHLGSTASTQLLEHLADKRYKPSWDWIATALRAAATHISPEGLDKLLEHLADERYAQAWGPIAIAIGVAATQLGPTSMKRLLKHLVDKRYAQARDSIARALRATATRLGPSEVKQLLEHLADERYAPAWHWISMALCAAATQLGSAGGKQLLRHLADERYWSAWDSIARAVGAAATQLNPMAMEQLLKHLADERYVRAWPSIASALHAAAAQLSPAGVKQLLGHLADERYAPAWDPIARALRATATQLGPTAMKQLVEHLADERYAQAQYWIESTLCAAATQLGPTAMQQLLKHLADERYAPASGSIASALRATATQLGPAGVKQLLEHLADERYEPAWHSIATILGAISCTSAESRKIIKEHAAASARSGALSNVLRILKAIPDLIWFVSVVNSSAEPRYRIVYDVAERNYPQLILNADLRFAPELIRTLLQPNDDLTSAINVSAVDDVLGPSAIIVALKLMLSLYLAPSKVEEFDRCVEDPRDRAAALTKSIKTITGHLTPEQAKLLTWRGATSQKAKAHRVARGGVSDTGHHRVNWSQFRAILLSEHNRERNRVIANEIYEAVVKKAATPTAGVSHGWAFICTDCTRILAINDSDATLSDREIRQKYKSCDACDEVLSKSRVRYPAEYLECPSCTGADGEPLRFTVNVAANTAANETEEAIFCPREACGARLIRPSRRGAAE